MLQKKNVARGKRHEETFGSVLFDPLCNLSQIKKNGVHWRPKKKFVTKTMDEKHNENMFFVFTTIFDPLGLPHPLLKARYLGFFKIFF